MLRIYKRFWAVNWAEQWQYRANTLMYLAYWLVTPVVFLSVWSAVARAQGSVSGLTANDFVSYYLILLPVDILTSSIMIHLFGQRIQDGTLSNALMQPVHPVLTNGLVNNVAFKALQVVALVPVWLLLYVLFQPSLNINPINLLLAVPVIALGFLIHFMIDSSITLLGFWTTRTQHVHMLYWSVASLLNGVMVPLTLLPGWAQTLANFLPFQLWIYFPIQLILGKLDEATILRNVGLQCIWLLAFYGVFRLIWSRGLRRYSAVGA